MPIQFVPGSERCDDSSRGVTFEGADGERRISFIVSREALSDAYGDVRTKGDSIMTFRAHRSQIEAVASKKYVAQSFVGLVIVTSEDFSKR